MRASSNQIAAGGGGLPVGTFLFGPTSRDLSKCRRLDGSLLLQSAFPALYDVLGPVPSFLATARTGPSDLSSPALSVAPYLRARPLDSKLIFCLPNARSTNADGQTDERGCLAWTTNGTSYSSAWVGGASQAVFDVAWSGSVWVARGSTRVFRKTALTDGSWSAITTNIPNDNAGGGGLVACGAGLFVCTGGATSNDSNYATSSDGSTWTARTVAMGSGTWTVDYELIWTGTEFLWARGRNVFGAGFRILRSTNGTTWTDVTPPTTYLDPATGGTTANPYFWFSGSTVWLWFRNASGRSACYKSTDGGQTWTFAGLTGVLITGPVDKIGSFYTFAPYQYVSLDGVTWYGPTQAPPRQAFQNSTPGNAVTAGVISSLIAAFGGANTYAANPFTTVPFNYDETTLFRLPDANALALPFGTNNLGINAGGLVTLQVVAET